MKNNRNTDSITLRVAAVLLLLVMITSCMVSGQYARYITTAAGSDSAHVAKFSIQESSTLLTENIAISMIPGTTENTAITIKNDSEVAVSYTVNVTNQNFPLTFQIQDGSTLHAIPFVSTLNPGATMTYTLITTWPGEADNRYAGMVDLLEISMSAVQID